MNKSDTHAFVNQLLVYTLVMICFSGSVGLGTVWLRQQIAQTANNVKLLESRTAEMERHLSGTNMAIAAEESPDVLVKRNAEWKLGLVQANNSQVVRIDRSPEQRLAEKRHSELFGREARVAPVRFPTGGSN
jgi:hypothetical protein